MNAIFVQGTLDSNLLQLPELRPLVGKSVDVFVIERQAGTSSLETLTSFLGEHVDRDPADDAAIQTLLKDESFARFRGFLEARSPDAIDVDAIVKLRALSPT